MCIPAPKSFLSAASAVISPAAFARTGRSWRAQYRRAVVAPDQIPDLARKHGSVGVAWTYNEPFIWYEYIMDAGRRVKEAGLINVLVTNGYVNPEPLEEMRGLIDAMNIDLKAIDDSFYRKKLQRPPRSGT